MSTKSNQKGNRMPTTEYDETYQGAFPTEVPEADLDEIRRVWLKTAEGETVFDAPPLREIQYYFNTCLGDIDFALKNLSHKVRESPDEAISKIERIEKLLRVCSTISRFIFRKV